MHLYGQPADLDPILEIARRHGLAVVEDAAQAHGARYKGRRIGAHGDIVCWSFYPGKNLGAFGDGGAITTNRADLADRVRVLRNYGSRVKYVNEVQGVNSRLDPVQAAVLRVKLAHLDTWNERRRALAAAYSEGLKESGLILPHVPDVGRSRLASLCRAMPGPRRAAEASDRCRDRHAHSLSDPAAHAGGLRATWELRPDALPIARQLAGEVLSLPMGPHLKIEQVARVVEAISAQAVAGAA